MSTLELEHLKHTSSSSNNLSVHSDGTVVSNNKLGIGTVPNATFGSLLYAQGTPAANKPIISGYSQGNSNNAGMALFNDSGNRGIWTTGSTMRFTRSYEGNSTTDMNIDASGRVTKPYNISFRVMGNSGSYLSTSPIPFPTTSGFGAHNTGGHFSTSTNAFTAPVAGKYFFHLHLGIARQNGAGSAYPYIQLNGVNVSYTYINLGGALYANCHVTCILDLAVNDAVRCTYAGSNSDYYGDRMELSFHGYLLG